MNKSISKEFLAQIPKTDLHVHLDGSLRLVSLIEMAKACKVKLPSYEVEGLKATVFKNNYANLPEYLQGFMYTCAVLQNAENLERVAYEMAVDNLADGVRYLEVRYAPQLHIHKDLGMEEVVASVCRGLARAKKEHNARPEVQSGQDIPFEFGIITCAMRSFNRHMGAYYGQIFDVLAYAPRKELFAIASLEMARAAAHLAHEKGLPVVGFDLAGEEAGYPALAHREAYQFAHSNFIKKTVHAGEAYGPESIFQAITECHANRIGHGTFLFAADMIRDESIKDAAYYVKCLAEYIASRRITIEVCLTSNLQTTPSIKSVADHPVRKMIDHSISVSICTDNQLVSSTTVTRELQCLTEGLSITPAQLRNIIIAGFKGSFYPGSYNEKRAYVRRVINRYDALEKQYLGITTGKESGRED